MTIQTATISGMFVGPDLSGDKTMSATYEAYAAGTVVTFTGLGVIGGRRPIPIQSDGTATLTIPKIPQAGLVPTSGVTWYVRVHVRGGVLEYFFTLTADTTWDAVLVPGNALAPPNLAAEAVAARDAAVAAAASVAISTWQPSVAVVAAQVKQAPDGTSIKRISSGTTRATFDATEQALWTPVATTVGTLEQIANKATYTQVIEAPLSPYRYGFVGNGTTDDTTALQNAINAVPSGGEMVLPHSGNAKTTAALTINKAMTIRGRSAYAQRILATGCDGIQIAAGTSNVHLEGFEIAQATRYSTTTNTFTGVSVDGATGAHSQNMVFRDIYVDGFKTAFAVRYTWSSVFDNIRSGFGLLGLASYGLSTNNQLIASQLTVAGGTGSKAVALLGQESASDLTPVAGEGWMIDDVLTNGAEVGFEILGTNHVYMNNSISDFNTLHGVRVQANGTFFANNIRVAGTYIGMTGATGSAAIILANTVTNAARRYARLTDNELVTYSGSTCVNGIAVTGAEARAVIRGNTSTGFSTRDCFLQSTDNVVTSNAFLSTAPTSNIATSVANIVEDNVGTVFRTGVATTTNYSRDTIGRKTLRAGAAPATLTWALGDRVINDVPTVGQPKAWVCTAAGTPGTWVSEGNL